MLENGEQIWTRIVHGESAALGELYDVLGGILYSLSFRILNDRWESEEVVQDVLSSLWRKPDAYSPKKGKLHSWLLTLVRNRSIDRYRSRSRRKDIVEIDEVILHTKPDLGATNAGDEAERSDERTALKKAFKSLPDDQQTILELSYFKGLSHSEIADATGLSLGTVKSRIRLGVEKLRRILSDLR
ncbi:MAG: sigma-70 family RNA polymerase sigma factor [Opitutae bacterium]|jgi:RNA polymerase sigma factor (sigma-70 family)|nr:sigma-70 family RNA polymerase sigma factor [Opitutae bacterium]MBT4223643.1 sigma-70 family RNA polymerase sigma factor [Opitutae bacterium]MBT5379322.1 sigma-70 family RNA polymerase sigma factor [Opitutae bacterium]MBT5690352.1 sigma-70 family RNA polymerase sigma factor [Opitutae bacterium]MBT6463713.1 sigma-70 family RNA polymerase sigma factor [Opitutae bacterium]